MSHHIALLDDFPHYEYTGFCSCILINFNNQGFRTPIQSQDIFCIDLDMF